MLIFTIGLLCVVCVCVYVGTGKPRKDNKEFDIAEALSKRKPLRKTTTTFALGT